MGISGVRSRRGSRYEDREQLPTAAQETGRRRERRGAIGKDKSALTTPLRSRDDRFRSRVARRKAQKQAATTQSAAEKQAPHASFTFARADIETSTHFEV